MKVNWNDDIPIYGKIKNVPKHQPVPNHQLLHDIAGLWDAPPAQRGDVGMFSVPVLQTDEDGDLRRFDPPRHGMVNVRDFTIGMTLEMGN